MIGRAALAVALALPAVAAGATPPAAASMLPAASMDEIMRVARRDLGKIDKELREEDKKNHPDEPGRTGAFSTARDAARQRLIKGIEAAHAAAPNKWYQAARIEEVTPPGDDARKIYKVTTALGTYCVRYQDKNRMWDHGQAYLGEPLIGACPHMF